MIWAAVPADDEANLVVISFIHCRGDPLSCLRVKSLPDKKNASSVRYVTKEGDRPCIRDKSRPKNENTELALCKYDERYQTTRFVVGMICLVSRPSGHGTSSNGCVNGRTETSCYQPPKQRGSNFRRDQDLASRIIQCKQHRYSPRQCQPQGCLQFER